MKTLRASCVVFLCGILAAAAAAGEAGAGAGTALTIYNDGRAVVREVYTVDLPAGTGEVSVTGVARTIDPASVIVEPVAAGAAFDVAWQSYEYDVENAEALLQAAIGRVINVVTSEGTLYSATLVSFDGGQIVLSMGRADNAGLMVVPRGENIQSITLGERPEGISTTPTLVWLLTGAREGRAPIAVTYQASAVNWQADYNAMLADDEKTINLVGWTTITNNSGKTFSNAVIKLVAGAVHRVEEGRVASDMMFARREMAAAAPQAVQAPFAEYHMYSLDQPVTVAAGQVKQVKFITAGGVPVERKYIIDFQPGVTLYGGGREPFLGDVSVSEKTSARFYVIFTNDKASNLGEPLPGGRVRVYKKAGNQLALVGEDAIRHTPVDNKAELLMGEAFDVTAERNRTSFERSRGANAVTESFEITVRNAKEEPVTVTLREHLFRWISWEIIEASADYTKASANIIEFPVTLDPGQEQKVTYTVRYTW